MSEGKEVEGKSEERRLARSRAIAPLFLDRAKSVLNPASAVPSLPRCFPSISIARWKVDVLLCGLAATGKGSECPPASEKREGERSEEVQTAGGRAGGGGGSPPPLPLSSFSPSSFQRHPGARNRSFPFNCDP